MTKHELFSNIFKNLTIYLSKKMPQWIRATLFMGQQKETPLHWDLCCFFSSQAEQIVCESWSHQTIIMKNTTEGDLFFNNNIFEAPPPQQGFIFSFTLQMRHPLRAFLLMQRFTTGLVPPSSVLSLCPAHIKALWAFFFLMGYLIYFFHLFLLLSMVLFCICVWFNVHTWHWICLIWTTVSVFLHFALFSPL